MAVELAYSGTQTVIVGGNVLFNENPVKCNKGYAVHRDGSGIVTLRGITNGQCRARYRVTFGADFAVPATGGTVGPIVFAIAIDGEPLAGTRMVVTPADVVEPFTVSRTTFVDVPAGCCESIAIENIGATPALVTAANLVIDRVA